MASGLLLASLPAEIISHIACQADTKSALVLASTCRRVREICYQPWIFKYLTFSRLAERDLNPPEVTEYRHKLESRCFDAETWARYSLVEDCLTYLESQESSVYFLAENPETAEYIRKLSRCQWTLLALRHPWLHDGFGGMPFICNRLRIILDAADEAQTLDFQNLLPILIAEALDDLMATPSTSYVPPDAERLHGWDDENWQHSLTADDLNGFVGLTYKIAHDLRKSASRRFRVVNHEDLPTISTLEFPGYINEIRPFEVDSHSNSNPLQGGWHKQAINPQSIEYLTTGTWSGYYTYGMPSGRYDPPMQNVRFEIDDGNSQISTVQTSDMTVALRASNCSDGCGRFSITLSVLLRTGKFRGIKRYNNGLEWLWSGMITPFGLTGHWGDAHSAGCIWLYKMTDSRTLEQVA